MSPSMDTAPDYLVTRQDQQEPKKITTHIDGFGALHGWEFPNGVRQFHSIPYASVEKNWTRAKISTSWENNEHDGTRLGPWSMQPVPWELLVAHPSDPVKPYKYLNVPDQDDQANCLTISLTIPPNAKNVPVMVFIHGGGFVYGASTMPTYDGFRFVAESNRKKKPIILCAINYRLGIFGFLASGDIARGLQVDGFEGNGNFAFTDQHTALHWINQNIGLFGGNAREVTIFGESAGGMSVGCQWSARKPAPFNRVIHHSGTTSSFSVWDAEQHERFYAKLLKYFNISENDENALEQLQAVPNSDINAATLDLYGVLEPLPSVCIDGWFWNEDLLPGPTAWHEPPAWLQGFMLGNVGDEGMIYRDVLCKETYQSATEAFHRHLSDGDTDFIFALYGLHEDVPYARRLAILEEMFSDSVFHIPDLARAHQIAEKNSTKVPSYFFHFDERCTLTDNIYRGEAFHAYDLLFVFLTNYEMFNEEQRRVADTMHMAWVSFAYGEEPWEEYKVSRRWKTWGPDGNMKLTTERDDEAARKTSRLKTLIRRKDVLPGFCLSIEDLAVKRYLVNQERPRGWAAQLLEGIL